MSNNSIYEKIEEKGRKEVEQIIADANQKAAEIKASIIDEANSKANELISNEQKRSDDLLKSTKTSLEQTSKQAILGHKKELINRFTMELINQLNNLDDNVLVKYFEKLLTHISLSLNSIVRVSSKDYNRYIKIFKTVENNLDIAINLSQDFVDIQGGFIIEGTTFDLDFSFDSIVKEEVQKYEQEIANSLFNEVKA